MIRDRDGADTLGNLSPDLLDPDPARKNRVTFIAGGRADDVALALSSFGVRVVIDRDLANTPVRSRFVDATIDDVLDHLAGRMGEGSDVFQREGYVYVGRPSDRDLAVRVFHVPSGEGADWADAFSLASSPSSEVATRDDLVIVRDVLTGVQRAQAFYQTISGTRRQYRVEVVFADLSAADAQSIGVELDFSGVFNLTNTIALGTPDTQTLETLLRGVLKANATSTSGSSWSSLTLHLVEGTPIRLQSGETVNVRRRVVTEDGFISDQGFEEIETGLIVELTARSVASGRVRVDLAPQLSEVVELVDGLPTVSTRELTSSAYLGDGGMIVVGGLTERSSTDNRQRMALLGWPTGQDRDARETRFFVFLRIHEINETGPLPTGDDTPADRWGGFGPPPADWSSQWGFDNQDWIDYNRGDWAAERPTDEPRRSLEAGQTPPAFP
ncbi:MAG: hypothetical protein AAF663_01725 [Planctomycetota bacterium]